MGDKSRNGIEDRDLIDMIKANMYQEKVRIDQYIHYQVPKKSSIA